MDLNDYLTIKICNNLKLGTPVYLPINRYRKFVDKVSCQIPIDFYVLTPCSKFECVHHLSFTSSTL